MPRPQTRHVLSPDQIGTSPPSVASDLQVIGEFGHGGQFGGQFTIIHAIAADSQNNIYVGESLTGNRVQRFLYKGTGPATRQYDEYGMEVTE